VTDTLVIERRGAVGWLVFDRPDVGNAMNARMMDELEAAWLGLDADADLARRAARTLGTPAFTALATCSGVDGRDLARRGLAWQHGGAAGLELLHADWDPPTGAAGALDLLKAARAALRDMSGTRARVTRNRVTAGRMQLRLGRDFLWYPYLRSAGDWEPAGPPKPDPAAAAAAL